LLALPLAALAAVEEIPVTTPSADARLAFVAGQAALDRGDGQQANDLFRTAVAADPNFVYAWYNLSNVTFSTEEFNAALRGAERGLGQVSDGERMLVEFNKLFLDNNFGAQLALAKQLTEKYPNSPRAWMLLAAAQAALNQFGEQRATLEKVIALAPGLRAGIIHPGRVVPVQRSHGFRPRREVLPPGHLAGARRGHLLLVAG
jgi:tetratricopeptide (TPR) repeat protein